MVTVVMVTIMFVLFQVIVAPYTDESLRGQQIDYIQTRISVSPSEMQDPTFHSKLGDKLARAYIMGKAKGSSKRKRRAIGSVSATVSTYLVYSPVSLALQCIVELI